MRCVSGRSGLAKSGRSARWTRRKTRGVLESIASAGLVSTALTAGGLELKVGAKVNSNIDIERKSVCMYVCMCVYVCVYALRTMSSSYGGSSNGSMYSEYGFHRTERIKRTC